MAKRATRKAAPISLAEERARREPEPQIGDAVRHWLKGLAAYVAARWRGHEPEIAILASTTLILAGTAALAGADLLFTFLMTVVAAVAIWSPWRSPN